MESAAHSAVGLMFDRLGSSHLGEASSASMVTLYDFLFRMDFFVEIGFSASYLFSVEAQWGIGTLFSYRGPSVAI